MLQKCVEDNDLAFASFPNYCNECLDLGKEPYDAIYGAAWQGNSRMLNHMLEELQSEELSRLFHNFILKVFALVGLTNH